MKLLAVAGDIDALIADIRLRTPLRSLCDRLGWKLELRSFHDCRRSDLDRADLLIVQRGISRRAWRLQQAMRQRGKPVIYEIDDLLSELPPHVSNHAGRGERTLWLGRCVSEADMVTVSTRRLGDSLGQPGAFVTPNHAMPLGDAPIPPTSRDQPVSLLLASMENLATDFIDEPLRSLQAAGGVQIIVVGPPGTAFKAAGVQIQAYPLMPRERFIAFARGLPNPVAVIPLEDTRFASCKSAIKWFEYAEAGLPVLCSNVSPYREVVRDGVTGRLVDNHHAAWQQALVDAVADGPWRQRVANAAREDVRERHTLHQTTVAWETAINAAAHRAKSRGPVRPTLWSIVPDTLIGVFDELAMPLRQRNRERLARRKEP